MNWTMEKIMDVATGYWRSGALIAAVELGLFDVLAEGKEVSARAISQRLEASEPHLEALLKALAGMNLLHMSEDGDFSLDPGVVTFLSPTGCMCLLDSLRFNADLYSLWGRLAETVRSGKPAIPPGAHLGMDQERTRRFIMGMHSRALGLLPQLLSVFEVPERGRLLDVASGPGTFSRVLAEQQPGLEVTQMDLPPVLAVARELTEGSPAAGRIRFMPGDYHHDDFDGPFDAALFCGALHQETPAEGASVIDRIVRAIRPGGRLIVADLMLDESRPEPAFAALFALTMMLTNPNGGVHSTTTVMEMMAQAGLENVIVRLPADLPYRVLLGNKPRI